MKINQTIIKKAFSKRGIQLGAGSMDMINREILTHVSKMANRCNDGNLKRLTPELFYVAVGDYSSDY